MRQALVRILGLVITVLVSITVAVLILVWTFNCPPVKMSALKTIKQGAARDEVEAVLGKPTTTYEANSKWAYSKPFGWSIVYVYFDERGRFQKYEYDY